MEWLSVTEAARAAGVSPDTVRRWCDAGRLTSLRTAGGHRRISTEALSSMLTDGPSTYVTLDRHTRDLASVFAAWRDQVSELRPFEARSFDDPTGLRSALVELEGPIGTSGLLDELSGLCEEIRQALDAIKRPSNLRALG